MLYKKPFQFHFGSELTFGTVQCVTDSFITTRATKVSNNTITIVYYCFIIVAIIQNIHEFECINDCCKEHVCMNLCASFCFFVKFVLTEADILK